MRNFVSALGASALVLGSFPAAYGFWDTGHVLVGEVARMTLPERTRDEVARLMETDAEYFYSPGLPYVGRWMDEIKPDTGLLNELHYVNKVYNPSGFPDIESQDSGTNVLFGINEGMRKMKSPNTKIWGKAFNFRVLTHLFGDIHQPCHAATFYSENFTSGDLGGNRWNIYYRHAESGEEFFNLHALFDSVGAEPTYGGYMPEPVTDDYAAFIRSETQALMAEWPLETYTDEFIQTESPERWANESFDLAVEYGYEAISFDSTVSDDYIPTLQTMLKERVVIAGYRLAAAIENMDLSLVGQGPAACASEDDGKINTAGYTAMAATMAGMLVVAAFTFRLGRKTDMLSGWACCQRRDSNPGYDDLLGNGP